MNQPYKPGPIGTPPAAPRRITYDPKPDITAYEAALCTVAMFKLAMWSKTGGDPAQVISELAENCRRHFDVSGVLLGN